jgi:hypothetical protein
MTEQAQANPAEALPAQWRRWTRLVAACAARRGTGGVTGTTYPELHRAVLDACRAARASADGADQDFYDELEGLVLPWVSLAVLARTERELLDDLHRRCCQAEQRLQGRKERPTRQRHLSAGSVALVVGLLLLAAGTFALDWWPPWLTGYLERQGRAAWNAWRALGDKDRLIIMVTVVALLSLPLLGRLARRK